MFELISGSILNSLTEQQLIRTRFPYEAYTQFVLSTGSITFRRDNFTPFRGDQPVGRIGSLDPLVIDPQLSHQENFQFLAPVYVDETQTTKNLGHYNPISPITSLSYEDVIKHLVGTDAQVPLKQKFVVDFSQTSIESNVFMQIFEGTTTTATSVSMLKKLDCIDFGEFKDPNDLVRPFKRIFFVGKVYANDDMNDYQSPAFVNLFTIVAE
jgi:hypothetical protein